MPVLKKSRNLSYAPCIYKNDNNKMVNLFYCNHMPAITFFGMNYPVLNKLFYFCCKIILAVVE